MKPNEQRNEHRVQRNPRFPRLDRPWLVAAWPGMGNVASLAGGHLASALAAEPAGMIPERELFPVNHVEVKGGIARTGALPRSMFFSRHDPDGVRDVLLFLAEAQPDRGGYALCHRILDLAVENGVERVVTFAALGTALHPTADPRVFGAVTAPELLDDLEPAGIERLVDGRVSGLNGALLAAAAERSIPAMCLLGEFPFFATAAPNPKSSLAVLRSFERLSGLDLELDGLTRLSEQIEPQLLRLLEQMRSKSDEGGGVNDLPDELEIDLGAGATDPEAEVPLSDADTDAPAPLAAETLDHIDGLFEAASRDRTTAGELKTELDRLGVFALYEDRFLDLYSTHD